MSKDDTITLTTVVAVDPARAFAVFTEEVDAWWQRGPRYRWFPERDGTMRFEGQVGGRFVEEYPDGECFEVGRIRVFEPSARLVFGFRARNFAANESTEVEVRFAPHPLGTEVSIEHRGWSTIAKDHPARHGLKGISFRNVMASWWADLLTDLRRLA